MPILLVFVITTIIGIWQSLKSKPREILDPEIFPELKRGRYFIGIDVGRARIKYCLFDAYNYKSGSNIDKFFRYDDNYYVPTPEISQNDLQPIYDKIKTIINIITKTFNIDLNKIDGIGLGFPGQIDLKHGLIKFLPGLTRDGLNLKVAKVVHDITRTLQSDSSLHIRFRVDNDVRCATRYEWKKSDIHDLICIFVGNGLGSGIVAEGKMLYGDTSTAGEAGHTTIFDTCLCEYLNSKYYSNCSFFEKLKDMKCQCDNSFGYHWEQLICAYGMEKIIKKCSTTEEYNSLKNYCEELKNDNELKINDKYSKHFNDYFTDSGDLRTYAISAAYFISKNKKDGDNKKNKYVEEIVEIIFLRYLSIGIANYINILNPSQIYLGGGMIKGFLIQNAEEILLKNLLPNYTLKAANQNVSITPSIENKHTACIGAALMFVDESYIWEKIWGK